MILSESYILKLKKLAGISENYRTVGFKYKNPETSVTIRFDAPVESGNLKFKIMDILDKLNVNYDFVKYGGGTRFNSYSIGINVYDEKEIETIINDLKLSLLLSDSKISDVTYS